MGSSGGDSDGLNQSNDLRKKMKHLRYFNEGVFWFMDERTLIPNLFRTEYRNIVSVLSYSFGIKHIEIAEDIVSDTFLSATEVWSVKGIPENPRAWLYAVAKNKIRNHVKRELL